MNFNDTLLSVELVIETNEVPLIVGESGIGKTALAKELAQKKGWSLVVIDGNLLKEGEIGGLPTIDDYETIDPQGKVIKKKRTIYAIHTKLQELDELISKGEKVLLFIDEINRCEHTVQQELMNLILNREINGYVLHPEVKILAAMNPSSKYGEDFDYQVVDMDAAQENRFVWLFMKSDAKTWLQWALENDIEEKILEFISTFPEYLHCAKGDENIKATPRSYERVSKLYKLYKKSSEEIPKKVFFYVLKGNLGSSIAQELMTYIEEDSRPLITFEEIFNYSEIPEDIKNRLKKESITRLYLTAKNIILILNKKDINENEINRFVEFIKLYPVDLTLGLMKEIKESHRELYSYCIDNEAFIETYFEAYNDIKG